MADDIYLINEAKTDFRDAYNSGDLELLLSTFDKSFVDMSQGEVSGFSTGANAKMRERATALFAKYHVEMVPIVIDIVVNGSIAYDYGWHEMTLTPKSGGQAIRKRVRYIEHWKKNEAGQWKISFFMSNEDVKEAFNGQQSRWFKGEDAVAIQ